VSTHKKIAQEYLEGYFRPVTGSIKQRCSIYEDLEKVGNMWIFDGG
jgi:hypothetical protein